MARKDFRNLLCYGQKMKQCYDYSNRVFYMQIDILFPQVEEEVESEVQDWKGQAEKKWDLSPQKGMEIFWKDGRNL